jgi:hypothetical protein
MSSSEQTLDLTAGSLAGKSDRELQLLLAAAVKEYARRQQESEPFAAFATDAGEPITGTDAVVAASAILEGAGVEPFELGMWKAWGGTFG